MTTRGELSLKGLEEYLEDLAAAGEDVDQAAANALIAGGDVILPGMQELVAVDTGDLKDHLHRTEPVRDGNLTIVEIGVFDGENLPDAKLAKKANAQEYGYTRGGKHYPGQPYARPGFDNKKRAALEVMKESLREDGAL